LGGYYSDLSRKNITAIENSGHQTNKFNTSLIANGHFICVLNMVSVNMPIALVLPKEKAHKVNELR
jgi:hypothetical protein